MSGRIPRHKARRQLERAQHHLARAEYAEAEALLRELPAAAPEVPEAALFLGDALAGLGREEEAFALWQSAHDAGDRSPELCARMGTSLSRRGRPAEALPWLMRAQGEKRKDPGTLVHLAFCALQLGQLEEAERAAGAAAKAGAGQEARLVVAAVRAQQGRAEEAERLCLEVEEATRREEVGAAARALRADVRLVRGDAPGALALWTELRRSGRLDPSHLGHMAWAAELAGDPASCDALVAERTRLGATAEDLLLFANVANLRARPEEALAHLDAAERALGVRHPGHEFEVAAARGRALRLLGRREQAKQVLGAIASRAEAASARLGPKVHVDLGHLAAEEGDFETSAQHFRAALALDPNDPEASHGLKLAQRRTAWRDELAASADARVEAAKAEAESLRRRFSAREGELDALRAELERLRAEQRAAMDKAVRAEEEARAAAAKAASEHAVRVRAELEEREEDAARKAEENLDAALGSAKGRCPPSVRDAFAVAERTFQKALYTELPPAAVAVLYTGALERALYTFFVDHFRAWLRESGRLPEFLKAAIRERRGTRVEYFDHFVEAFDEERPGRAPSMGEVGRVIERRNEPYLHAFKTFVDSEWPGQDDFLDQLGAFVQWTKEHLRDPVAHGRGEVVDYTQLRWFREQVLVALGSTGEPLLRALVPRRA